MQKIENRRVLMIVLITISLQIFLGAMLQASGLWQLFLVAVALGLFVWGIYEYRSLETDCENEDNVRKSKEEAMYQELIAEIRGLREDLKKR